MKFKNLSLAVFSAFMLSACGGGSSDSTGGSTGGSTGDSITWASYVDHIGDTSGFVKETLTVVGDTLYSDYTNRQSTAPFYKVQYLTRAHHYDLSKTQTSYGYKIATVTQMNNQWKIIPFSSTGNTQLQITNTYKSIDLSGKKLAEYLDNDKFKYKYDSQYLAKFGDSTFPQGSSCLMFETENASEDYVVTPFYHLGAYQSVIDYFDDMPTKLVNFAGFNVHLLDSDTEDEGALVEENGVYFYADYYRKGENYNWYELNPNLDDECSLFNPKASKTIDHVLAQ